MGLQLLSAAKTQQLLEGKWSRKQENYKNKSNNSTNKAPGGYWM